MLYACSSNLKDLSDEVFLEQIEREVFKFDLHYEAVGKIGDFIIYDSLVENEGSILRVTEYDRKKEKYFQKTFWTPDRLFAIQELTKEMVRNGQHIQYDEDGKVTYKAVYVDGARISEEFVD